MFAHSRRRGWRPCLRAGGGRAMPRRYRQDSGPWLGVYGGGGGCGWGGGGGGGRVYPTAPRDPGVLARPELGRSTAAGCVSRLHALHQYKKGPDGERVFPSVRHIERAVHPARAATRPCGSPRLCRRAGTGSGFTTRVSFPRRLQGRGAAIAQYGSRTTCAQWSSRAQ